MDIEVNVKALLLRNRTLMEEKKKAIDKLSHERVNLIKKATKEGMSVTDVAKNLGISRQRVYKIIKQGRK
tara:strand:- start:159 stop:368 length:210 start_codon:yes stop_codon:yes gene_type:complete